MGLFSKKKKNVKPNETNEMENKELKESIANAALELLVEGDDYASLANTMVEYGYLVYVENHGIEALLKITTDKTKVFIAVQGEKIMRLNFTEELFQVTVEGFWAIRNEE